MFGLLAALLEPLHPPGRFAAVTSG